METKRLVTDDGAVSQVVAVVLLVAIVILLTAVIGPVVIGLGEGVAEGGPAPQVTLNWTYNGDAATLTMAHTGGETLDKETLKFVGSESGKLSPTWNDGDDRLSVTETGEFSSVQSGEIVRVFWADPDDDTQQLIAMWIGPDADPPDG